MKLCSEWANTEVHSVTIADIRRVSVIYVYEFSFISLTTNATAAFPRTLLTSPNGFEIFLNRLYITRARLLSVIPLMPKPMYADTRAGGWFSVCACGRRGAGIAPRPSRRVQGQRPSTDIDRGAALPSHRPPARAVPYRARACSARRCRPDANLLSAPHTQTAATTTTHFGRPPSLHSVHRWRRRRRRARLVHGPAQFDGESARRP